MAWEPPPPTPVLPIQSRGSGAKPLSLFQANELPKGFEHQNGSLMLGFQNSNSSLTLGRGISGLHGKTAQTGMRRGGGGSPTFVHDDRGKCMRTNIYNVKDSHIYENIYIYKMHENVLYPYVSSPRTRSPQTPLIGLLFFSGLKKEAQEPGLAPPPEWVPESLSPLLCLPRQARRDLQAPYVMTNGRHLQPARLSRPKG